MTDSTHKVASRESDWIEPSRSVTPDPIVVSCINRSWVPGCINREHLVLVPYHNGE